MLSLLKNFYVVNEADKTNYLLRGKGLFIHYVKKIIFILRMNLNTAAFAFRDIAIKAAGTAARKTMTNINKDRVF